MPEINCWKMFDLFDSQSAVLDFERKRIKCIEHNLAWCPGPMLKNRQLKVREEGDKMLAQHILLTRWPKFEFTQNKNSNNQKRRLSSSSFKFRWCTHSQHHRYARTYTIIILHLKLISHKRMFLLCFCRTVYGLCSVHRFLWNLHSRDWQPTIIVNASGPTNQIVSLFALSLSLSVCTLHRRQ